MKTSFLKNVWLRLIRRTRSAPVQRRVRRQLTLGGEGLERREVFDSYAQTIYDMPSDHSLYIVGGQRDDTCSVRYDYGKSAGKYDDRLVVDCKFRDNSYAASKSFPLYTASVKLKVVGLRGDFNVNGVLDVADINTLTSQSASGADSSQYDLTGDGQVNATDIIEWISAWSALVPTRRTGGRTEV